MRAEFGERGRHRHTARIGKPCLDMGIGEATSLRLDVRLANDATVVVILFANKCAEFRPACPIRNKAQRHEFLSYLRRTTLGTSGSAAVRVGEVTASARNLPALSCSTTTE